MTHVNIHSRALVEVDDLDISQIPANANSIVKGLEIEADILNKINEAFSEPFSKYLFEEL